MFLSLLVLVSLASVVSFANVNKQALVLSRDKVQNVVVVKLAQQAFKDDADFGFEMVPGVFRPHEQAVNLVVDEERRLRMSVCVCVRFRHTRKTK